MQGTELSVHKNVRMSNIAVSALGVWQSIEIRKTQEECDASLEGRHRLKQGRNLHLTRTQSFLEEQGTVETRLFRKKNCW